MEKRNESKVQLSHISNISVSIVCFLPVLISFVVKLEFDSQITRIAPQQEITNGF